MQRSAAVTVIAILAFVQGVLGVLRAFHWFDIGSDMIGQGLVLLPVLGMVVFAKGMLIAAIALLYVAFAFGLFTGRDWARPLGLIAVVVNVLLVLSVLIQGEFLARALFWLIVPAAVVCYLLSPGGHRVPAN